jgi:hypothetical protein
MGAWSRLVVTWTGAAPPEARPLAACRVDYNDEYRIHVSVTMTSEAGYQ